MWFSISMHRSKTCMHQFMSSGLQIFQNGFSMHRSNHRMYRYIDPIQTKIRDMDRSMAICIDTYYLLLELNAFFSLSWIDISATLSHPVIKLHLNRHHSSQNQRLTLISFLLTLSKTLNSVHLPSNPHHHASKNNPS